MSAKPPPKPPPPSPPKRRVDRLADALKRNIARRKAAQAPKDKK